MKLSERISSGVVIRPQGMFWHGPEGTRKTGSAVSPKTLFLDLERGSDQYDVDRIHIVTYRDLLEALDLVIRDKTHHEIIVVDPIEIAEKLLIGETCRQLKIDGLQGLSHGAAWQYLRENFDAQLMARFNEVRRSGRHMIVIGHAQVRTVTLPGLAEPFDRYEPRIDKRNADTLVEWADAVLFFDSCAERQRADRARDSWARLEREKPGWPERAVKARVYFAGAVVREHRGSSWSRCGVARRHACRRAYRRTYRRTRRSRPTARGL